MIKKVEHVAIMVKNMDEAIAYYSEMFGFKLRDRGQSPTKDMAFIYHENHPGFEIELIQDLVPLGDYSDKGIVNHLAFTVDNIEEAMAYYKEKGIQFTTETPNTGVGGSKTLFFYGPSQELLQFVQPAKR